jgi:hypothetical protein
MVEVPALKVRFVITDNENPVATPVAVIVDDPKFIVLPNEPPELKLRHVMA